MRSRRPSRRRAAISASAEANLSRLQEMQGYKTVKAPFDGVITARNTDIGALMNAGNGRRGPGTVPHCGDRETARLS